MPPQNTARGSAASFLSDDQKKSDAPLPPVETPAVPTPPAHPGIMPVRPILGGRIHYPRAIVTKPRFTPSGYQPGGVITSVEQMTEQQLFLEDATGVFAVTGLAAVGVGRGVAQDVRDAQQGAANGGGGGPNGGGGGIRGEVQRVIEIERGFANQLGRDLLNAAGAVSDAVGRKIVTVGAEKVAEFAIDIAPGLNRAPAVEIGSSIFTGTAGAGEEAAIAAVSAREVASSIVRTGLGVSRVIQSGTGGVALGLVIRDP